MKIAVFGAGGVGGYFGARLAQVGKEVVFIARGAHLQAMRRDGLRLESIKGDAVIRPVQATDNPAEVGPVDGVLVGVKAWQVPQAAREMAPLVGAHTFVVPLQNGVEAPAQLAEVLGRAHVLGGLCKISSFIAGPGLIRHVAVEPYIAFGELDGGTSERCERLRQAFERAGVWAEVPANITVAMWEKFLFIAAISGVGSVTRSPVGVVRRIPETRSLLEQAMGEIYRLAVARMILLDADIVQKTMAFIDQLPEGTLPSMQRDIMQGRPSELQSQNGAVVRLGAEVGEFTPVHGFIYASLLPSELQARGKIEPAEFI